MIWALHNVDTFCYAKEDKFCSNEQQYYSDQIQKPDRREIMLCKENQRTNGPVNAHLRSAVYTNAIESSPSIGADEALGPFFFFRIINILSIQVFPFK